MSGESYPDFPSLGSSFSLEIGNCLALVCLLIKGAKRGVSSMLNSLVILLADGMRDEDQKMLLKG